MKGYRVLWLAFGLVVATALSEANGSALCRFSPSPVPPCSYAAVPGVDKTV